MRFLIVCLLVLAPGLAPVAAPAQGAPDGQTLADINQELQVLYVRIRELKRELSTTQSPGLQNAQGSFQERLDALEFALQKMTAKTEELENRIETVVSDGTMQINDLAFRVCELEKGCDPSKIDFDKRLGGAAANVSVQPAQPDTGPANELAVGEQDDFDRALKAFDAGDYQHAADLFEAFNTTYPSGPLAAAAHLYRGLSLDGVGDTGGAARAYLDAFSANPDGKEAPAALFQLGLSLNALGQTDQACVTLSEVGVRFPTDVMVQKAENARARIGCS